MERKIVLFAQNKLLANLRKNATKGRDKVWWSLYRGGFFPIKERLPKMRAIIIQR
jgi:hypothetical protein